MMIIIIYYIVCLLHLLVVNNKCTYVLQLSIIHFARSLADLLSNGSPWPRPKMFRLIRSIFRHLVKNSEMFFNGLFPEMFNKRLVGIISLWPMIFGFMLGAFLPLYRPKD